MRSRKLIMVGGGTSFKFRPRGCSWRDGLQGPKPSLGNLPDGRTGGRSVFLATNFAVVFFFLLLSLLRNNVFPAGTEIHSLYALERDVQPTRRKRYEYAESAWIFQPL